MAIAWPWGRGCMMTADRTNDSTVVLADGFVGVAAGETSRFSMKCDFSSLMRNSGPPKTPPRTVQCDSLC
jgi:hypothetical protein